MRIKGLMPNAQSVRAIVDREMKRLREMSDGDEGKQQLQDAGEQSN